MTYPEWSSLIRVNSFIEDLNLYFFPKKWAFCPPCQIKQWAFVQWDIVQWAFVLVGFCPSGLLSVPQLLGTFLEKDSDYDRLHIVPIKGVECQTWRCDGCVRIQIQNSHLSIWNLIISQGI